MKKLYFSLIVFLFTSSVFAQSPGACGKNNLPQVNDGSASLGFTFDTMGCGLNYVHADKLIETRFNQYTTAGNLGSGLPTVMTVNGIPPTATVVKAYAWYIVSYLPATTPNSSVVLTNPNSITSTIQSSIIGQDQGKCWGEVGTAVYRADVTSAITGNGNYGLDITGMTGAPSGNFANNYDQIDGITLFIIYKDFAATYQGAFEIWDGNMTGVGNTFTQTMTNINACANSTYAEAFLIASDLQDNVGQTHPATLNGITGNFPNKMYNFDDTITSVSLAQSSAVFGVDGQGSDCFAWAMMGLYFQTNTCMVCQQCTTTTASIDSIQATSACSSNDGAIYISDSTIAPPLAYSWSNGATTQDISGLAPGTYILTITDSTNCSVSVYAYVTAPSSLSVSLGSVTTVSCSGGNNGAISVNVSGGTPPYTYSWSNSATTQNVSGLAYGIYSLTVTDSSGCVASFAASVMGGANLPAPDICMVTVDSLSQNNVIMWDETLYPGVDSFIVYREITTNTYMPLGAVSPDSLSLFIDTVRTKYFPNTGDPNAGTYRYKIQLKDSCGGVSVLSPYHNTIFMTNNNGNFNWGLYTIENGPNPVNAYVLMRDDYSNGNWNAINSVSGTQQTVSDPAYSNWQATASYRIQTLWNITCTPSRINPDALTSYNASLSNISGLLSAVNETSLNDLISVYPNPTMGAFTIYNYSQDKNCSLKITNAIGETVLEKAMSKKEENIHLTGAKGIYFLHLKTPAGVAVKKIVKE